MYVEIHSRSVAVTEQTLQSLVECEGPVAGQSNRPQRCRW